MPRLEVLQVLATGYDSIDLGTLPERVTLANVCGIHNVAVSEWVVGAILTVLRGFPKLVLDQAARVVDRAPGPALPPDSPLISDTLDGKTVMLLGYGGIGQTVEQRLAGFDVELVRVARTARKGIHSIDQLDELLPRADIVVLALPLSEETRGLVDAAFLSRLRDGALLVNCSRGGHVDQDALAAELRSGRLRAALDAATPDPLPREHPLLAAPNLLYTPHIAGLTTLTFPRMYRFLADQVHRFIERQPLECVVRRARAT
jgi:phosphoglycerate dehydrogenase-like enzyme